MAPIRREDLTARSGVDVGRRAKEGAGSLVYTFLVLASLGLALALGVRFRTNLDFTRQRENSLSPKSEEALAALSSPVKIWALFKDRDPRREAYWDLLRLYSRRSNKVAFEFVDPNARPAIVQTLKLTSEEQSALKDGLSVAVRGDRRVVFRGHEEEDVTNSILEVGSDEHRVVGFARGIGERDPASTADDGFGTAAEALRREYYDVIDIRLDAPIPPQVTVVVIAGPRAAIPRPDLDRLGAWMEAGGRLLVLADGEFDSGIGQVTEHWGLRAKDTKIIDRRQNLRAQPEIPLVTTFTRHPIVRGFSASLPLALPLSIPVEDFEPGDPTLFRETIAKTSSYSEGLTPSGSREAGPFGVVAASYKTRGTGAGKGGETRTVLVGDVTFATNAFFPEQANRDFFLNSVGWLARARGFVSVRNREQAGQELALRRKDVRVFRLIVVAPPLLVVAIGIVVFLRRRGL